MSKHILIADDNGTDRYLLEALLTEHGMSVTAAQNGREALEKARTNPPDLVVADILMPVMDGYALCREWKADEHLKHIPFVFYTATFTGTKDETLALSLGADRFIVKPQEPDALMSLLNEVLAGGNATVQVKPLGDDMEFFRQCNAALFGKLEKKMRELEETNLRRKTLEEERRLFFEHAMDMIYMLGPDFRLLDVSPSVERILGYAPRDLIGLPLSGLDHFFSPESFGKAKDDADRIMKGEAIAAAVYRFIAKDGTVKTGEVSGASIKRDGRPAGIVFIARDITSHRLAEEKVWESERRYRELYDFLPIPVFEMDLEGNITAANLAIHELFGVTETELKKGGNIWRFLSPEGKTLAWENMQRLLKGEKTGRTEYVLTRLDGSDFPAIVISSIIRGDEKAVGFRGAIIDITERKRAEDALKESEKRYRSVFEDHAAVKYIIDLDTGGIVEANEAATKYYGWSHDQLTKMTIQEINTLPLEEIGRAIEASQNRGETHFEFRHRRADGSIRDVEVFGSVMEDQGKKFLHSIVHDITERKRSEALYQTLAESSLAAVFIVQDGKFRFINKSAIAYMGYTEEDILGRDSDLIIYPEDKAMVADMGREMLKGKRSKAYEFRIVSKDNRIRWLSQMVTPIIYDNRPAILGNALDVTDLKESLNRLEEMKALESSIMSAIPHVVVGFQDDTILFVNDASEAVFGWKPEELIGQRVDILCHNENECRSLGEQLRHEGGEETADRQETEIHCLHRDGSNIVCKVTSCLIGGTEGHKTVSMFEDITEKKLSHIQLLQSEKMASIGKLAAGVAHEINNPTAFVSSNLKTLAEYVEDLIAIRDQYRPMLDELKALRPGDPFSEAIGNRVRQIESLENKLKIDTVIEDVVALIGESREGTGRISRIVQDLKNFAHPGEEKQTTFNVNENIESTLSIVWNELKYKTTVNKDYGDIPRILGYPQQLNQVFMNILVNAAQAIKDKGEIRISTRVEGPDIAIRISDTGTGIPPENLPKLFDPFFTTKEVGKGTGLGLHVAYSIIEKHNGTISVESTVGVGTTFTVRIPIQTNG